MWFSPMLHRRSRTSGEAAETKRETGACVFIGQIKWSLKKHGARRFLPCKTVSKVMAFPLFSHRLTM
jgi:hypothetical protein